MHTPDRRKIGTPRRSRFEGSPTYCFINDLSPIQPVEPKDDECMFQSTSFSSVDSDFSSPEASIFFRGHSISLYHDVCPEDFHGSSPITWERDKEIYSFDKAIMECLDSPAQLTQYVQFKGNKEIIPSLEGEHNIGSDSIQTLVEVQNEHYQATPNKDEESPHVRNKVKHLDKEEDGGRFCESDVMMPLQTPNPFIHNIILAQHAINHTSQTARHYNEAGKPNISISADCKASKDTQVETQHHGKRRWCLTVQNKANRSIINTRSINQQQGNSLPPHMAPCIGMLSNTPAISQDLMLTDPFCSIIAGNVPFSELFNATQDQLPIGTEAQNTKTNIFEAPECGTNKKLRQHGPRLMKVNSDKSGDCKKCKCINSLCLKLYCECFAASVYCTGNCSCQDCLNIPIHQERVLAARKKTASRNPLAFAPKIEEDQNTPASIRHKNGCNCKKSTCQKKYCECYQGGVACSRRCRCDGCKNEFGTKNGEKIAAKSLSVDNALKDKRNVIIKESEDGFLRNPIPLTPSLERSRGIIIPEYVTSRAQPCSSTHSLTLNKHKLPVISNIGEQFDFNKENVCIPLGENISSRTLPIQSTFAEGFDSCKDNNKITSEENIYAVEDMDYDIFWKMEPNSPEKTFFDDVCYGESSSMHAANNTSPNGKRVLHSSSCIHLSRSVVHSRPTLEVEDILPVPPSLDPNLKNDNIMHPSSRSFR